MKISWISLICKIVLETHPWTFPPYFTLIPNWPFPLLKFMLLFQIHYFRASMVLWMLHWTPLVLMYLTKFFIHFFCFYIDLIMSFNWCLIFTNLFPYEGKNLFFYLVTCHFSCDFHLSLSRQESSFRNGPSSSRCI